MKTDIEKHEHECNEQMRTLSPGPWTNEPHRVEFEYQGFPCLIVRSAFGLNLCGYVGVPQGHPWFEVDFVGGESGGLDVPDVHGGLTYNSACHGYVCHVPKPGESDNVWWIGFDCAHYKDVKPRAFPMLNFAQNYRDVAFVRAECEQLATQAFRAQ